MRRNFKFKKALASVLCIAIAMCIFSVSSFAAEEQKYDIVFAVDTSTSMKSSDPNGLVPQSIELFTDLIADGDARYGVVAYGQENEFCPMTDSKKEVNDYALSLKYDERGTDIPEGLAGAESLFKDNGSQQYIILLTDGKNEYHKRTEAELAKDLDDVRSSTCKVYTIGLNCDNNKDYNTISEPYLEGIASDNGGKNYTVKSRSEILAAYLEISKEITNIEMTPIIDNEFNITEDTVIEAIIDIYFDRPLSDWRLEGPDGEVYTSDSADISIKNLDNFIEISLFNPSVGTWHISHTPDGTDLEIKKYLILSYDVDAAVSVSPEAAEPSDKVAISVSMSHSGELITDRLPFFERFECTANVISPDGSVSSVNLEPVADGYLGEYEIDKDASGEYSVEARIFGGRLDTTTATKSTFNVENNGPKGFPWIILVIVAILLLVVVAVVLMKIKQRRLRGFFDDFFVSLNGNSDTVNGVVAPRRQSFTLYDLLVVYYSQTTANNASDVEDFLRTEQGRSVANELKKVKISVRKDNKSFNFKGSVKKQGSSINWQAPDGCLDINAVYSL